MLRFWVYTGKEDATNNMELVLPEELHHFTKPEKMVVFLLLPYLDKGHTIYMDNWYSSVQLYQYLLQHSTTACGTLRKNKTPVVIRNKDVCRGEIVKVAAENILCLKFVDSSLIHVITTEHNASTQAVLVRGRRRRFPGEQKQKPVAVCQYNKYMGGVDKMDQVSFEFLL